MKRKRIAIGGGQDDGGARSTGKVAPFIKAFYPEYYVWEEHPVKECIAFKTVRDPWGVLGNFYPAPLVIEDVAFVNSEQLFQMMKFTDRQTLLAIYRSRGLPLKWAAEKGEKEGLCRSDWGRIIIDCMKFCLQTKHDQCEEFRKALAETTGFRIVEDQTNARTLKKGKANTWGALRLEDQYVGSNLLGILLMELRDKGRLDYRLPADMFDFMVHLKTPGRF